MPLPRVLESYDPVLAGRSRVAGLAAQVVRLVPGEADKYGFVLWIDEQSHLLLRVDMVDREGNLVGAGAGSGSGQAVCPGTWLVTLAKSQLPEALALEDAYPTPQQTLNWHLTWLPDGFKVLSGQAPASQYQPAGGLHDALGRSGGSLRLRRPGRPQAGGAPATDPSGRHLAGELCQRGRRGDHSGRRGACRDRQTHRRVGAAPTRNEVVQ